MSWLFSQALVEEFSAATCSDGAPSAQLSIVPTQHPFWRFDKTMEPSDLSRFGLTCAVLTADRGAELLTWYLVDSRARISASPVKAPASAEQDPGYGITWHELSARYDRDSCSWKTHQRLFQEDLAWSSVTFPKWGMTVDGVLFQRQMSERRTAAKERGSWPTPTAMTPSGGTCFSKWGGSGGRRKLAKIMTESEMNGPANPVIAEWLMGWPIGWTDLTPLETVKFQWPPQEPGAN